MRIIDVQDLGYEAALVAIAGEKLLLLEAALDVDQRIEMLTCVMEEDVE